MACTARFKDTSAGPIQSCCGEHATATHRSVGSNDCSARRSQASQNWNNATTGVRARTPRRLVALEEAASTFEHFEPVITELAPYGTYTAIQKAQDCNKLVFRKEGSIVPCCSCMLIGEALM